MKYAVLTLFSVFQIMICVAQKPTTPPKKNAPTFQDMPVLIEQVREEKGKLIIPYKKYKLSNGMIVILHEDQSDPLVHVDITYHVGSAREEIGKSGFAHFFEHMMFQGSEHVGDEMHFKYITEAGGTLNGTTNRDRTNYFETLPFNGLELALWLEADRMGFLLDSVTQRKFEVQRATVKNERGQRYDNVPYGLVQENISKNIYPYGHPYSWMTIGYTEDLDRVDVNDLKKFFMRWYGPNNATLTIGGSFNSAEVLKLIQKYFGGIKPCPQVNKQILTPVALISDRFVSMEDKIRFPQLNRVFLTSPRYSKDEAALDILSYILGNGKNSYLYRNFEKNGMAVNASCYNATYELSGEFQFVIRAYPGMSLKSMDSLLNLTLNEFDNSPVSEDELKAAIAHFETEIYTGLEAVQNKVSRLAAYQTFLGNANYINKELVAYRSVTVPDIKRVFETYIKGKNSLHLSCVPKGQKNLVAMEDNYSISKSGYKKKKDEYTGLKYIKAKDGVDRSKKPNLPLLPGEMPVISWNRVLPSGIPVYGIYNNESPIIEMQIVLSGGHLLDAYNTELNGLAYLTARMMNESSNKIKAEKMVALLEQKGSDIHISSNAEQIVISVTTRRDTYKDILDLLQQRIMEPAFDSIEFELIKKQILEEIANRGNQPPAIAGRVYARLLFGDDIKGLPERGTIETIQKITLNDIRDFYKKYINPSKAYIVFAGDIRENEAVEMMNFMNTWKQIEYALPTVNSYNEKAPATALYLVDKPGAAQSELRVGNLTSTVYNPLGDHFKMRMYNYVLGGNFNSRINLNLREKNGWTYGARSEFGGTQLAGIFTVSASVKSNATDSSIRELMGELNNYLMAGMTDAELQFMRNAMIQGEALKYEKLGQKLEYLKMMHEFKLDPLYQQNRFQQILSSDANSLQRTAVPQIRTQNMYILVVGDKKSILPGLQQLGYKIVELNSEGIPVN